ncbi:MAG: helix-turn-helix domain-containing protein [Anaerolineae bacterium]|nr:helix-turn-helix domain-containing protein [Anaerolineae bacterium]
MEQLTSGLIQSRVDRVIIQSEMLRSGFAALPYLVMRDKSLSLGARMTYAFLLMYAWQEGSCFAGQKKLAEEMGVSERQLQRYIYELRDTNYIAVERKDKRYNNTYVVLDRKKPFKLKRGKGKVVEKMA